MPANIVSKALSLSPEEAVRFLESKGYKLTWDWKEQLALNNAQIFTVAKVAKLSLLQETRNLLVKALDSGAGFEAFRKDAANLLPELAAYRLRTIYKTNMQTAWNTGRWQAFEESKDAFPYLQYIAVIDQSTSEICQPLDGQIHHIDDPFWDIWSPPNHFNCRCRLRPLTALQAGRAGEQEDLPPGHEPSPGFNSNPAKRQWEPDPSKFDPDIWSLGKKDLS